MIDDKLWLTCFKADNQHIIALQKTIQTSVYLNENNSK